jgi:tRNA A37 threonylcarbamoyladenosine dehydratase
MAERCRLINPDSSIRVIHTFLTSKTVNDVFDTHYDYAMDAIDSVNHKCTFIDQCVKRKIPALVSGGAGGRIDPTQIKIADLSKSINDQLLKRVRKKLRQEFEFPRQKKKPFNVECVFSTEEALFSETCETDETATSIRLDCSSGFGAATHITGTFGFFAASKIVQRICQPLSESQ